MLTPAILAVLALTLAVLIVHALRRDQPRGDARPVVAVPLLSDAERDAYSRLTSALPQHLVLAQVPLCRFVHARSGEDFLRWHNSIAQLSADFVIATPDTRVIAVVELDDATRSRPLQNGGARQKDAACAAAGIPVIRWSARALPQPEAIRKLIAEKAALSPA